MVDLTEPEIIPLTNNSLEIIEAVNRHVNRSIAPPPRSRGRLAGCAKVTSVFSRSPPKAAGLLSATKRRLRAHPRRSRCLMLRSKPDVRSGRGLRLLEAFSNYLRAADCDPSGPSVGLVQGEPRRRECANWIGRDHGR